MGWASWPTLGTALALLSGCQSAPLAIWQTAALAVQPGTVARPVAPGVNFMKVVSPSGVAYMVLGDEEAPAGAEGTGPVQVWYSAGKQVLRLHQGRVAGTAGLPVDWRSVRAGPRPPWAQALNGPVVYGRERDEMPGYRFQILERVTVRSVQTPAESWAAAVAGRQTLAWFTEEAEAVDHAMTGPGQGKSTAEASRNQQRTKLPVAWFAVDLQAAGQPVVFSRQCLSPAFCLTMEPMPITPRSAGQGAGPGESRP